MVMVVVCLWDIVYSSSCPPAMSFFRVFIVVADFSQKVDTLIALQKPDVNLLQSYASIHRA